MLRLNLTIFNALLLVGFLGVTTPGASGASEPPKRLRSNIEENQTFVLKGNIHPSVAKAVAQDQGEVASSKAMPKMSIHFAMTAAQQADLQQLLAAQQNRRSAQYRRFLTPEEYGARFGLNTADLEKITNWLASNGFSDIQTSRSRMWVEFRGSAGQVQSAFHTSIHNYTLNGVPHFANATEPELPKVLDGVVEAIAGLHNYLPKAHIRPHPQFTSSISGDTFLAPDDWATIYDVKALYGAGLDGSPIANPSGNYCGGAPCSIVVVGQSDVRATDLSNFRVAAGLPAKAPTTVIPPGDVDPGFQSGDEGESDLDLEWSGAIAKNGNILFVTADQDPDNGVEDSIAYAIGNNVAPVLSTSYGLCEPDETISDFNYQQSLFAQANAQGMTITTAAGDAGAADCDTGYPAVDGLAVDFPASSQYVTGIGGTTLTVYNVTGAYWSASNNGNGGSALQYIPEVVWNDTSNPNPPFDGNGLEAGGGGVSTLVPKPSWQTGTGVPGGSFRDVPDIALTASPNENGLLYCTEPSTLTVTTCSNGFRNSDTTLNVTGGTSAGAPTFAGIVALLVQQTGARLGNVNPNLYTVAGVSGNAFHDITSGNNIVPCTIGTLDCAGGTMGYSAGVGYDQASGWGSIDANYLFEQWSMDILVSSSPTTLSIQPGASGTATITVAPFKGFTGAVSFACSVSSSLTDVTCSVPSTTVTTSGSTTVTITATSAARSNPFWRQFRNLPPMGIGLLMVALIMSLLLYTLRKQRFVYAWGAAAMLVFMLGAVSCGGGSSSGSGGGGTGPAAESGNVTVTATGGSITNSVSIAVTIP